MHGGRPHRDRRGNFERADVITYLRRLLGQAGISGAGFLDVHMAPRGPGKC
ncbi:MAG: hypothetical protein IT228_08965 [Flavobacteriales bacterium]|nr:hypothetical protein [Flavobacteriales bacterium]MCC6577456.1 hypothetical protein [Flavobacteriales bacterium]